MIRDNKLFISVLTTVPPHTDLLVISTKTQVKLFTEDDPLPWSHSMTVWHDTSAVFGDTDVVLRAVVVTVRMHVVMQSSANGAGTNRMAHGGHYCSLNVQNHGCWVSQVQQ